MKSNIIQSTFAALMIAGLGAASAIAGDSASQVVSYEVQAINELSVSAGSLGLVVDSATAGSAPNAATNSSTTYAITTNELGRKITGALGSDMPAGVTLSVTLGAPTGATSLGKRPLAQQAVDLVTGISTLNETGKSIAYELAATSAAGVVPAGTRTVTLTITAQE
jgi:hypothetical protein